MFLLSILKVEYTKTKFKNIGKSQFPQLLNKLFESEAIKNKNNIIQSFKRAGIFPLDPSSVDVSRILKNNKSTTNSSTTATNSSTTATNSSTTATNTTNNDSINNSSTSVNFVRTNNNHHSDDNDPPNVNIPRSSHNTDVVPPFASYRQAISTLEDVLQNPIISYSSDNDDDNEDDDEDYIPPKSISTPSITVSSSKKQISKSKKTCQSENDQLTSSRKSGKRKKVSWDFSSTDSTDEGNFYI